MSRQLDALHEERQARRGKRIIEAVEYALEKAVGHSGAELTGLAVKLHEGDCMLVIKGHLGGRAQVCFVGAEDFGSALLKAVREGNRDKLRWRDDAYVGQSEGDN